LRILLSFQQDHNEQPYNIPAYRFWAHYIKNGIAEAGMQWMEVPNMDWAAGLSLLYQNDPGISEWRDRAWRQTVAYIKNNRENIDLFLCYLYPKQIDVNAIKQIRQLGIPCVNFYCDHIREFKKLPAEFKVFDLMWVPEYEALKMYNEADIKYINLPMPMWVDKKFRDHNITELPLISFIGSKDILRQKLLNEAINKGLDISIRGNGWIKSDTPKDANNNSLTSKLANQFKFIRDHGFNVYAIKTWQQFNPVVAGNISHKNLFPSPDFEDYINLTRNSKITLGINRVPTYKRLHSNPLVYSRLRDIEAPMLAACYLAEYSEGLSKLYDLNTEIYAYKTIDELVSKALELSNDKNKRDMLRKTGQQKALNEHAIPASLNKIKAALFK
jgi:hypothetical protein